VVYVVDDNPWQRKALGRLLRSGRAPRAKWELNPLPIWFGVLMDCSSNTPQDAPSILD